jgi:hypothetical protein
MSQIGEESPPVPGRCRRFTLGDALILVAALAVGCALARLAYLEWRQQYGRRPIPTAYRLSASIELGQALAFWMVTALTLAYWPLRLRRPRPTLGRVMRQPGATACGMAPFFLAELLLLAARDGDGSIPMLGIAGLGSLFTGTGVAVGWSLGWWWGPARAEPGWIDAMGRALGACWMILPVVFFLALSGWV